MTGRIKVWGVNIFFKGRQRRAIVASSSQKGACDLLDVSRGYLTTYGAVTFNEDEVTLATAGPGTVFVHISDVSAPFHHGEWVEQ